MKRKTMVTLVVLLLILTIVAAYFKVNYKSFDEAVWESGVPIDEIFHTTDFKGHKIIFYGDGDILSAALIEKTLFGFQWSIGGGSKLFNEKDFRLTWTLSNMGPRDSESDEELVSLTFGVVNDPLIEEVKIKYKDQDSRNATIVDTSKGRIWYCFSGTPLNYDPDVTVTYKDGTTKTGWY